MRVTAKLVVAFVLGIIVVTGISIWWAIARETEEFHRLANEEARRHGEFLENSVAAIWRTDGHKGVLQFLKDYQLKQDDLRISWVWCDTDTEQIAEYVYHYWPVNRTGGLEIAKPMTALRNVKRDLIKQVLTWMGSSVLVSGILMAYVGMRFVGRPLKEMAQRTREIAAGNLEVRIEVESNDELGQLAKSFNVMCGKLKASQARAAAESAARLAVMEQLRQADRLKTVGRLAAGVAHELGTPLNVVAGRAQLIASGKLQAGEIVSSAETVKHEASRMTSIIRQLLDFARRRAPQRTWVDLRNVVDQTTTLLESLARKNNTTITVKRVDRPCCAEIDAGQIEQVLTNLTLNAIQAMPGGGHVQVEVTRRRLTSPDQPDAFARDYVCLAIRDEGTGIAAENTPNLFEPFFTTKSFGEGTGLGLSISYGIVQEHGGYIDVQSKRGSGSCFTVYLPVGDAE